VTRLAWTLKRFQTQTGPTAAFEGAQSTPTSDYDDFFLGHTVLRAEEKKSNNNYNNNNYNYNHNYNNSNNHHINSYSSRASLSLKKKV
jgi:hypothetical protein